MTDSELLSPGRTLPEGARPAVSTNQIISALADSVSKNLPEHACYLYRDVPTVIRSRVEIDKAGRPIQEPETLTLTVDNFATWVENYMLFIKGHDKEGTPIPESLGAPKIKQILSSFTFRDHLHKVKEISAVRLPVRVYDHSTKQSRIELAPNGLDPRSRVYTLDLLPYPQDSALTREAIHAQLEELLGEFPWADIQDQSRTFATSRNVACFLAYMVGQYCRHLIAHQPIILFNANKPGSGKTLLACMGLGPMEGAPTVTGYPDSPDELRKTLFAKANSGANYVLLDDIPDLKSKHINQVSTAGKLSDRRMHAQEELVVANSLQLIGTGNRLDTTADISRRALIIDLFSAREIADATHTRHLDQQSLNDEEWRRDMLALLWQLVRDWQADGCPMHCNPDSMKSFGDFASIAGSIVVHAGFSNPFEKRAEGAGGDSRGFLIRELIETAANLRYAQILQLQGLLEPEKICYLATHPEELPDEYEYSVPDLLNIALEELGTADRLTWGVKDDQRSKSLGLKLSEFKGNIYRDKYGREFEFGRVKRTSTTKYTFTWLSKKIPVSLVASAEAELRKTPAETPFDE
jgi:hypothetical protein